MKHAKLAFTILIVMLICCSYSIGQSPTSGVRASYYPIGPVSSSGIVSLGAMKIDPIYITHMSFICDVMASCGLYPTGPGDLKTGASVYPASQDDIKTGAGIYSSGQIRNGAIVALSGVRSGAIVSITK
jgi:hypothetical protein